MFDNRCDIRANFLSSLESLFKSEENSELDYSFLKDDNLPKKEGIFQHIPLYNLYKNEFKLSDKPLVQKTDIEEFILKEAKSSHLIFINGYLDLSLSDISLYQNEIDIEETDISLGEKLSSNKEYNFFMLLNKGLSKSKVNIKISKNADIKSPLHILNVIISDSKVASISNQRINIDFKERSCSNIHFSLCNLSEKKVNWSNQGLHINIDKNAKVNFSAYYPNLQNSYLFNLVRANLKKDSTLNMFVAMEGGPVEHQDYRISLDEENATYNLNGIILLKDKKQSHMNIQVDHNAAGTNSNQLVKSVLKDESRSGFEATVNIEKNAQKSVSHQLNKNLILSEKSEAFSKPFLKVYADDVKATHGATIYRLQEEDLFYLSSRGLNPPMASYFLIKGFCQEIINIVNIQTIRDILNSRLIQYLG